MFDKIRIGSAVASVGSASHALRLAPEAAFGRMFNMMAILKFAIVAHAHLRMDSDVTRPELEVNALLAYEVPPF